MSSSPSTFFKFFAALEGFEFRVLIRTHNVYCRKLSSARRSFRIWLHCHRPRAKQASDMPPRRFVSVLERNPVLRLKMVTPAISDPSINRSARLKRLCSPGVPEGAPINRKPRYAGTASSFTKNLALPISLGKLWARMTAATRPIGRISKVNL